MGVEEIVESNSVDPFWNYEKIYLGSGDDTFYGDVDGDYIETGGGSDKIKSGAGDDIVVVQASEENEATTEPTTVEIDTGLGDDHIVLEADASGILLVKNGAGFNTFEGLGFYDGVIFDWEENDIVISFQDTEDVIRVEDQYILNEDTGFVEIADTGMQFFITHHYDDDGELPRAEMLASIIISLVPKRLTIYRPFSQMMLGRMIE